MSAIKNKPLKKIVCDKRITIDVIHNDKIKEINDNNNERKILISKINEIKNEQNNYDDINLKIENDNEILKLDNKLKKIDESQHIEYYLDNGLLLSDYYNKDIKYTNNNNNTNTEKKKTVIDLMNYKSNEDGKTTYNFDENNDYKNMIKTYMVNINDNYINDYLLQDINMCKKCNIKLYMKYTNSEIICEKCGYTEKIIVNLDNNSYKDPIRESTYFAYKRINHFNEWLAQFQAKETTDISEEIYNNILKELKKDKNFNVLNVSYKLTRDTLKKLGYNKYYEHIPHIINIITGKKNPILDRNNEEQLRIMFKEIQQPFMNNCPDDRKNFLSYAYVLHKFCELLELDELLIYFPLLKSREKLQQQDFIWKKICHDLKWQFIPSI
jgi:predicted amidophosphoribosyltransferase